MYVLVLVFVINYLLFIYLKVYLFVYNVYNVDDDVEGYLFTKDDVYLIVLLLLIVLLVVFVFILLFILLYCYCWRLNKFLLLWNLYHKYNPPTASKTNINKVAKIYNKYFLQLF